MNESEIKNALLKLISESTLSNEDKALWNELLGGAPPEIVIAVHSFLLDYGNKLQEATEFLKRKVSALKAKDGTAWNKVLKDEELFLNKN